MRKPPLPIVPGKIGSRVIIPDLPRCYMPANPFHFTMSNPHQTCFCDNPAVFLQNRYAVEPLSRTFPITIGMQTCSALPVRNPAVRAFVDILLFGGITDLQSGSSYRLSDRLLLANPFVGGIILPFPQNRIARHPSLLVRVAVLQLQTCSALQVRNPARNASVGIMPFWGKTDLQGNLSCRPFRLVLSCKSVRGW